MPLARRSPTALCAVLAAALAVLAPASAGAAPAAGTGPAADTPRSTAGPQPERGPANTDKSIGFYVGKNLTDDGSVLLGGFGHEPSSHWLEIVPRTKHPKGATVEVGATGAADIPGRLTRIPQVERTAKYITMNYSEFAGFPAPLTNGGLNEHQVAARDIWSDSRPELVESTPTPQEGPQYSDLSRIAMERATTAREAVEIVGGLIDEHGYTTYGGNSHLFADEDEGWVLVEFAGGEGLWAAERLGPDDVRVSYPGYIGDFPTDYEDSPDHMGSPNLVDFAEEKGWYDPDEDDAFNLQDVYGVPFPGPPGEDDEAPYRYPPDREKELRELAPVKLEDMLRMVRDPRWSDDRSGYGQVAPLRDDLPHPDLGTLWVAPTASVTAPYIPWHIGAEEVPPEYGQHRYLTSGAAQAYIDPEYAAQEATRYPVRTFKRLMYYTCDRPEEFLGEVTDVLEGYEASLIEEIGDVEAAALKDLDGGDPTKGRASLTDWSGRRALEALDLGDHLVADVEQRTKDEWGIRAPSSSPDEGVTALPQSGDMSLGADAISARDRMTCDMDGGWADGTTVDRKGHYGDPAAVPEFPSAASRAGGDGGGVPWAWALGSAALGLLVGAGAVELLRRRAR